MLPHQCDAADGQFGFPFVMWKNADAVLFGSLALPRAHGELRPLRANDPTPRRFYSVYWKGVTGGTDSSPTLRWREMDLRLMRGDITTAVGRRHQRPIWEKHRRGEAHEDQAHQRRATP